MENKRKEILKTQKPKKREIKDFFHADETRKKKYEKY